MITAADLIRDSGAQTKTWGFPGSGKELGNALRQRVQDARNRVLRGGQVHTQGCYRWGGWIAICEEHNLVRSISGKGCTPDNSACEGLFGRMKNESCFASHWSRMGCAGPSPPSTATSSGITTQGSRSRWAG